MTPHQLKRDLARRSARGISNIIAGVLLWSVFGALGLVLPDVPQRALIYLVGAGLLLPLGLLLGRLLKLDLLAPDNPLARLGGVLGAVQVLFIPLMLGVLVGAHFLPFAWLYDSRAYLVLAIGTTAAAALTGWLLPAHTFVATPFAVAAALLVGALLRCGERRTASHLLPQRAEGEAQRV